MFWLQGLDEGKAWLGPPLTSGNMCVRVMHACSCLTPACCPARGEECSGPREEATEGLHPFETRS